MSRSAVTRAALGFTQDMRRENIKSLSWFMIMKYLNSPTNSPTKVSPIFLNFLTEYCGDCEDPEDSMVFVRILNLLVLTQLSGSDSDDVDLVKKASDLFQTLVSLKKQCSDVTQPHIVQLNKLISEAQCQVILAYIKCDDIETAMSHWERYYGGLVLPFHIKKLSSQLKHILNYLIMGRDAAIPEDEMTLSMQIFLSKHSFEEFCQKVKGFVTLCVTKLENKASMFKYNQECISMSHPIDFQPLSLEDQHQQQLEVKKSDGIASDGDAESQSKLVVSLGRIRLGERKQRTNNGSALTKISSKSGSSEDTDDFLQESQLRRQLKSKKRKVKFSEKHRKNSPEHQSKSSPLSKKPMSPKLPKSPTSPKSLKSPRFHMSTRNTQVDSKEAPDKGTKQHEVGEMHMVTRYRLKMIDEHSSGDKTNKKAVSLDDPTHGDTNSKSDVNPKEYDIAKTSGETSSKPQPEESDITKSSRNITRSKVKSDAISDNANTESEELNIKENSVNAGTKPDTPKGKGDVQPEFKTLRNRNIPVEASSSLNDKASSSLNDKASSSLNDKEKLKIVTRSMYKASIEVSSEPSSEPSLEPSVKEKSPSKSMKERDVYDFSFECTPPSRLPARLPNLQIKPAISRVPITPSVKVPVVKKSAKFFTVQETEFLQAGIKKFGWGKWKNILDYYPFKPGRSSTSLKDKARNMKGR